MEVDQESRPRFTTKPLGYELGQEVAIKFEEGLFDQAFLLLKELLISGISPGGQITLPNTEHLAIACTLAVHPTFTTRAKDQSFLNVSISALDYLQILDKVVNPLQIKYAEAYAWPENAFSRRSSRRAREPESLQDSPDEKESKDLRTPYANSRAIWHSATDFWAVAGWAFRCSRAHPRRWRQAWSPWMNYMIGVVEKDWIARKHLPIEKQEESLLAKYWGTGDKKHRVLRAIFADDSDRSASEFKEIWKHETKPAPKAKSSEQSKKQEIDIDQDEYGDYLDQSSEDEEEDSDMQVKRQDDSFAKTRAAKEFLAIWGGHDAGLLRLRLLSLVFQLSQSLPERAGDLHGIFSSAVDYIRPLPLGAFVAAFSPSMPRDIIPRDLAIAFVRFLTHTIIQRYPKSSALTEMGPRLLIDMYLPQAAKTNVIVDNARLSICNEILLSMVDDLPWSKELEAAVEEGIKARKEKATQVKGKKGEASGASDEKTDRKALDMSETRLRMMVMLLKK